MISYKPLWETMKERGITTYALINRYGINPRTIHNLKHDKSISLYTMEKLCRILQCQAESIVLFEEETEN